MEILQKALRLLLANKGKLFLLLISILVFGFLLFPFSDLSDLVSSQVSKLTQNQVYLQFEQMKMSVVPSPGMSFQDVHVEAAGFPAIKTQELTLSPALSMLITQKPAGSVIAKGILRGDLEVSLKPGTKSDNGIERQKITLTAKKLSLGELRDLVQLPVSINGNLDANSTALVDFSFKEQPDADLSLKIDRLEMPASNLNTMMGPVYLPDLKISNVEIKGRLSAGKILIETGTIGKESDELHGTIKGNMDFSILNRNGTAYAQLGGYSFDIDLAVRKSLLERGSGTFSLLDAYVNDKKTVTPEGATYKFKASAQSVALPPSISALR